MTKLEIIEKAQMAFWKEIAKNYPNVKDGFLSIEDTIEFDKICEKVVTNWIKNK